MSGKAKKSSKQHQPSVEPGNDGEDMPDSPPNDQLISAASASNDPTMSSLPGFSDEQVNSLDRHLDQLLTRRFNDFFVRLQTLQQQGHSQDSPALPTIEPPEQPRNRRERRQHLQSAEDQSSEEEFQTPLTSSSKSPALLKAEDVGFFDPGFQPEQEHGKTTPGPVVNAGKHAYYLDVFVFVDRLKELARKHGPDKVIDLIPSCLRGTALIWWTVEVDDFAKELLEGSKLEQWTSILIKQFRTMPTEALSALCSSTYSLQDLQRGISPRMWIHGQLHLARSAELDSVFNQLTIIYSRMGPYFQEQLDPPSPTTKLSDFLHKVDMKTTAWRSRAAANQQRQSRGFQPQGPQQQNPQQRNPPPTSQSHDRRGVRFEGRPKMFLGKENGKNNYAYMVDPAPDGTPQWADEDPDEHVEDDDYTP